MTSSAVVDLSFYGHYLETVTPLIAEVEARLPDWVTPVSFVSVIGSVGVGGGTA